MAELLLFLKALKMGQRPVDKIDFLSQECKNGVCSTMLADPILFSTKEDLARIKSTTNKDCLHIKCLHT